MQILEIFLRLVIHFKNEMKIYLKCNKNAVGTFYIALLWPRQTFWMFLSTRMSPIAMYIWFASHNNLKSYFISTLLKLWLGKIMRWIKSGRYCSLNLLEKETKEPILHWSKLTSCNGSSPNFYSEKNKHSLWEIWEIIKLRCTSLWTWERDKRS